ncbi:histidine kinase N-terminal 7TM domain-containing protein [Maridesulfovibrio sp.]|uniref:histidine kinase N-terminal 7TM domain-containing diguanylate cyclase n=1 Tax=Maridesulfovibrio sp. TaxID=2795000 RepID=UPI002A1889F8|nr:histidine kinase N-terminal 7TM domain-containing protein [Maridesulfovibrio sp.]
MEIRELAILLLCITCSGILGLVYYSIRLLDTPGSRSFILFMLSVFVYSFGYMFELSSSSYEAIYLAIKLEYLGVPFISVFWFLFAMGYNNIKINNKLIYTSIFAIPIITVIMLYTNELHHLQYKSLVIDSSGPFPAASYSKGTWYYIGFIYETVLSLVGIRLFYTMIPKTKGYRKKQAKIIFSASLIPWAGHVLSVMAGHPYGIDIAPFFLSLSVPVFAFAMFRLRMFNIVPIARDKVFETMNSPVLVLDKDFFIVDFNNYACSLFPELTSKSINQDAWDVLNEHKDFLQKITGADDSGTEFETKVKTRHYSGSITRLFSSKQKFLGSIVLLFDITDNKLMMTKLHQMATIDTLTQVHNRGFFMESCQQKLEQISQQKGYLSFLLIDIDHFKKINDTYGHTAGDYVLKNVTEGFRGILRSSDICGRYGGEEFAILLPQTGLQDAERLSKRLLATIKETPTNYKGTDIHVTISVGISSINFIDGYADIDLDKLVARLLNDADKALYQAKNEGRNRVCIAN